MSTKINAKLIGVPLDLGAQNLGVDVGPDAFRYRKIIDKLDGVGISLDDLGDVTCTDRKTLIPAIQNFATLTRLFVFLKK